MLVIASYALNVLIEDILNLPSKYEAVYPVFWASAVAVFITSGSAIISGGVIAKNKEQITELRKEQKPSWIFGVGFLLAAMVFLIAGILWGKWSPAWIAFPAAALLSAAVSVWKNSSDKS